MDPAAKGVTQKEDREQGMDQQDICDGMVFFLAALTRGLCRRGLGADDAPLRPVMGTRGETGATAGTATTGAGASSRGTTTVAAASETPSRCTSAASERVGASPRVRSAAQASLDHLERGGLEGGEQEEQPIFRCRQGAVLVHGTLAGRPGFPIQAPRRHRRVKHGLTGRNQRVRSQGSNPWETQVMALGVSRSSRIFL
jgi:hypothetical protein